MRTGRLSPRTLAAAATIAVALAGCGSSADDDDRDTGTAEAGLERKIDAAEKVAKARPADPAPLAELAKARFQMAGLKNDSTGEFSDEGKAELRRATQAWERYVALDPEPLDTGVAQLMAAAYGPGSLDDPKKALEIQQLLATKTRPPDAALFVRLAQMAYYAGDARTGRRAAARAIELTPKSRRRAVREALAAYSRQQP